MSQKFLELNSRIAYAEADSRGEAVKLRNDAKDYLGENNKCVVIMFEKRYHLYLAPGYDPYQIRREIDEFMRGENKVEPSTSTLTATQSSSGTVKKSSTKSKSSKRSSY